MTPGVQVYIGGERAADGSDPNEPNDAPFAVDGLQTTWGRSGTLDQPAGSVCSFTMIRRPTADPNRYRIFANTLKLGVRIDVDADAGCRVFTGQVTVVTVTSSPSGWVQYDVVADDCLTDLSNRPAGEHSRPVERLSERLNSILANRGVPITISPTIVDIKIKAYDADADSGAVATNMLQQLAVSVGATLWSTVTAAGEPALYMEAPSSRPAVRRLEQPNVMVIIGTDTVHVHGIITIDGCIPDLEPISVVQNMDHMITGCAVTYYDESNGYEATVVTVKDPADEASTAPYGVRRASLDSQLVTETDASIVAAALVARMHDPTWSMEGLTVDSADPVTLSDDDLRLLLGMSSRIGRVLQVHPLPPWVPDMGAPDKFVGYTEGGTITSTRGYWAVTLNVAAAISYAGANARWMDLNTPADQADTWTWRQFDPAIAWLDLTGVAGPA